MDLSLPEQLLKGGNVAITISTIVRSGSVMGDNSSKKMLTHFYSSVSSVFFSLRQINVLLLFPLITGESN